MTALLRSLALLLALAAPAVAVDLDLEVIEGNALKITMGPFVDITTGAAATPTSLTYRLDAPVRRASEALLAPVTITPASSTVTVYVPHTAVRLAVTDDTMPVELTVTWTSPSGYQGREIARFTIARARFGG